MEALVTKSKSEMSLVLLASSCVILIEGLQGLLLVPKKQPSPLSPMLRASSAQRTCWLLRRQQANTALALKLALGVTGLKPMS